MPKCSGPYQRVVHSEAGHSGRVRWSGPANSRNRPAITQMTTISRTMARPDGLAAGLPDAQVAHGLQADGVKGGGEGRQVVGDEKDFDDHAGGQDEHADDQKADAAIEKDAAHHDERRKQHDAGKN